MIGRLVRNTLWIAAGSGATFGVYWAFLNTPESSAAMLAVSAALALVAFALAGITVNGVVLSWTEGGAAGGLGRAVRGLGRWGVAAVLVAVVWWDVTSTMRWLDAQSGEISAWFIARLGWADVRGLFTGARWVGLWLQWIVAPVVALSLLGALLGTSRPPGAATRAIRRALSPLRLVLATLWGALLVAGPWVYLAPWRPKGLPASTVEPAFVVVKLLVVVLLMSAGAALVAREAVRGKARDASR